MLCMGRMEITPEVDLRTPGNPGPSAYVLQVNTAEAEAVMLPPTEAPDENVLLPGVYTMRHGTMGEGLHGVQLLLHRGRLRRVPARPRRKPGAPAAAHV